MDLLLQCGAESAAVHDSNGDVPLHFAAIHGHPMVAYRCVNALLGVTPWTLFIYCPHDFDFCPPQKPNLVVDFLLVVVLVITLPCIKTCSIAKSCPASCLARNAKGQTPVDAATACERGEVLNAMLLACAGSSQEGGEVSGGEAAYK